MIKIAFQCSLPANFKLKEENDGIYIYVESDVTGDEQLEYLVNRELDWHFFLTSVKIKAEIVKSSLTVTLGYSYRIHGQLPANIGPQRWNYELPIQLRLWALADHSRDMITKVILLFQIIELAFPASSQYPEYRDSSIAPHPLTECKFVRHLVAHAGDVSGQQLKLYCNYLGWPERMHDPTDISYMVLIKSKLYLLETQAKDVITISL
ncbi:MAG: hypothetical protein A2Z09_00975 [Nitrospirae bacterium RBG_16_43_8]|nr:MAG: hypothetical protein A2Z09_00975 [Nitrospirae bacterium RBG_16_43_8]